MDDDLPGYFDEPEPVPEPQPPSRRPPPGTATAVRPWPAAELIPLAVATHPTTPTTVVVQVMPLRPDDASRRLAEWTATTAARRRPWYAGRDRLAVVAAAATPTANRTCCRSHVRLDVRARGRPPMMIEVGCAPWSSTRAELHVVPVRAVRDRRRYYRAAHAVLDRLVRDLR